MARFLYLHGRFAVTALAVQLLRPNMVLRGGASAAAQRFHACTANLVAGLSIDGVAIMNPPAA
jgi:hypothetical protein